MLGSQPSERRMFGNAEAYEKFMGRWSRQLAPLLVDFADLPTAGHILDVGSGTGALAFVLREQRPKVQITGIDPSAEYVAYASSRKKQGQQIEFQQGDAQKLSFADRTFTSALSLLVFNFIPDPGKALREIVRVTKPDGKIVAAVWDYGDRMRMLRVFWDAAVSLDPSAEKLDEKHMQLCREGELGRLWKEAGLQDVEERSLEITMKFGSFRNFWDPFLLGQGPAGAYVRRLQPVGVPALRSEVKRRLGVQSEDRPIGLPARVWAVRGSIPA